jgi:hypothetical protein
MADVEVFSTGPLFNGQAHAAVTAFLKAAEDDVAKEGVNMVKATLGGVLQHPTGYYESQIQTDRAAYGAEINDDMVIYGPWLEGVGSRNATTRFKGYFSFRKTTAKIQAVAGTIAAHTLARFIGRMN